MVVGVRMALEPGCLGLEAISRGLCDPLQITQLLYAL